MAGHSSILFWEVPQTEQPGRLQSMDQEESGRSEQLSTHLHRYAHVQRWLQVLGSQNRKQESKMAVAKRRGWETRENRRKVKGRSEDRSEDLRQNKQHSWLAQFTYSRPRGEEKTYKKRSQRARASHRAPLCECSLSLFLSLSLSSLHVFWVSMPHDSRMYFPAIF